jgi:two-component sensor histidine kinase
MLGHLQEMLTSENFMPHGMCFLWRPDLLWLHAASDAAIALAYYSIPFALVSFVLRRRDLAFPGVFLLFGAFILACGTTHLMGIWTLWNPDYWLDGGIKAATAVISLLSAVIVWRVMPLALALPSPAQLEQANRALSGEIEERLRAEDNVRELNRELESRVAARTADLEAANAKLRAAVEEKEVLLREVHHRVKNNLQVVSGLLGMQARHASPELRAALQDAQERIRAMGRVHEQLHAATGIATVALDTIIRDLCEELGRVYGATQRSIACAVELPERIEVGLDLATPLALIVNEVLSNAFKHAFPEGNGSITVRLERRAEGLRLEIRDDGRGLPHSDGSDTGQSAHIGLRLVELLARQLDAVPSWRSNGGTTFDLHLPYDGGEI